jgi:hypothetical protein
MELNYKGWIITEYYDSEGYCDEVIYQDGSFSDSAILSFLRMNTPVGVVWKEQTPNAALAWAVRMWHSTEYIKNGLIADSLVATLYATFPPNPATGTVITPRYSLSISTVSAARRRPFG